MGAVPLSLSISCYIISYLHVADLVANAAPRAASSDVVQTPPRLVSGSTVARPGTRRPLRPSGPFRL